MVIIKWNGNNKITESTLNIRSCNFAFYDYYTLYIIHNKLQDIKFLFTTEGIKLLIYFEYFIYLYIF